MFQSTNACSQKHVDPGQAAERKGTFRPLPACCWVQQGSGGHVRLPLRIPPPPQPRKRPGCARRGRGGRTGGSPPSPASRPSRPSRQADAPSPTRLPRAPFLSVTSYIITRANQNGSDARCRGLSPRRDQMLAPQPTAPRTRRRGARLPGVGGKGPSADSARPSSEKALPWPVPVRKPRASPTASASSNTFHGLAPA